MNEETSQQTEEKPTSVKMYVGSGEDVCLEAFNEHVKQEEQCCE